MPDQARGRGPGNRTQVDVSTPEGQQRWAQYFRVSAAALIQAVMKVGSEPDAVAAHLGV